MYTKLVDNCINYSCKSGIPQYVFLTLGNKCNANCIFCDVKNSKEKGCIIDVYNTIKQLAELNVKFIHFTGGGEPFTESKLIDYCKFATKYGLKVAITTNGLAMNKNVIEELLELNLNHIIFSMDSHIAKLHNESRRVNGLWEKLTDNIKMLKERKKDVKIVINHVLTNRNIESFIDMIQLKEKVPYDFINPIFVKDNEWLYYTKDQLEMFIYNLSDYRECAKQYGVEFLYDGLEKFIQNVNHNEINYECRVPDFCAFIDASNAKVYPCDCAVHRDNDWYAYGNVNDDRLKKIWESNKKKVLTQEIRNNMCSCKNSCDMANIYFNRYLREEL